MKKNKIVLCLIIRSFTCMGMDVEDNIFDAKSNNNNQTAQLLQENNKLLKDLIVLTRTKIIQSKIHFEYDDDKRYTTDMTINQHAKNTQQALDNLYKATNTQLEDKALHIPMTGQVKNNQNKK